ACTSPVPYPAWACWQSAQRGQPLVVRTLVDALEQRGGEVALAGVRQHGQQHRAGRCLGGDLQRGGNRRAGGDADEDAFLGRQAARGGDRVLVADAEDAV